MGKSSPPAAPNPVATAQAQSASNVDTAAANAALNYTNQFTPYGATTYQQTGQYQTPGGETVPQYSQYTELSPLGQSILTGEQGVASSLIPGAQQLAGTAATSANTPLNFNTPYSGTLNEGPQLLSQNATDALYSANTRFLDPQWKQQQTLLQDQLSRQGIPVGSEAYNNAMEQFDSSKTQAYGAARDQAVGGGTQAASNLFNMALQGQQQNIGQQQTAQSNPIALLQQLTGAAPATQSQPIVTPQPSSVAPTDVVGATGLSTNAAMQAYQAQLAQQNSTFGGLASLGGAGILALSLSDPRAKEIGGKTDGALDAIRDIPVSDARYKWDAPGSERPMVMAPDVQRQMPGAVTGAPGGHELQMVNFGQMVPLILAGMQELERRTARHG